MTTAELTLIEIAERINRHLKRLEAKQERSVDGGTSTYYHASAIQNGSRVSVRYVGYHDHDHLTKREATHYLGLLDRGEAGRHWDLFREHPLPEPDPDEIRFLVLARDKQLGGRFFLYGVTKRTPTRVYGRKVAGPGYGDYAFLDKRRIVKLNASREDLDEAVRLQERCREAVQEARREFSAGLAALREQRDTEEET